MTYIENGSSSSVDESFRQGLLDQHVADQHLQVLVCNFDRAGQQLQHGGSDSQILQF